jgi:oligopeptide transport system substrate-binding protein
VKKRIALLLASATVASSFLAGCSGAKKDGGPTTAAVKQEVTFNLGDEPATLDTAKAEDELALTVLANAMEGLVRSGDNFQILPGIAEKWEISADGLSYVFHLRKDAKWSDGKPVTSQDFKFSWLRALDPKTGSTYGYQLYYLKGGEDYNTLDPKAADFDTKSKELAAKVGIETPDANTLKVTLKSPTPFFLGLMSFATYLPEREDIVTKNADKFGADADKTVYDGPFTVDSWAHDDNMVLKKNPTYWDAGAVKLDTVNLKMIKDNNTAVQQFETGEVDYTKVSGEFINKYKDKGLGSLPQVTTWYLTLNQQNAVFQNKNIRKAINLALDRKNFTDNVLKNGSISAEGLIPPTIGGEGGKTFRQMSGSLVPQAVNKDEATKLFAQGLKDLGKTSLTLKMISSDSTSAKRYAQGVQEMLQSALPGLTIELEPVAFKVRLERTKKGQYDIAYQGWGADYNDPMTFMDMWTTGNSQNDAKWSNKAYDDLVKKAATDPNPATRMKGLAEAEKIIMEELPIVPLYNPTVSWVAKSNIKGVIYFTLGPDWDLKKATVEAK